MSDLTAHSTLIELVGAESNILRKLAIILILIQNRMLLALRLRLLLLLLLGYKHIWLLKDLAFIVLFLIKETEFLIFLGVIITLLHLIRFLLQVATTSLGALQNLLANLGISLGISFHSPGGGLLLLPTPTSTTHLIENLVILVFDFYVSMISLRQFTRFVTCLTISI